jgi:hypothetical protein
VRIIVVLMIVIITIITIRKKIMIDTIKIIKIIVMKMTNK